MNESCLYDNRPLFERKKGQHMLKEKKRTTYVERKKRTTYARFHSFNLLHFSFKRQIVDSSKLTDFADDNFKSDENDRRFSKQVENTVGKGLIDRDERFLLFPQCFQKTCAAGM